MLTKENLDLLLTLQYYSIFLLKKQYLQQLITQFFILKNAKYRHIFRKE